METTFAEVGVPAADGPATCFLVRPDDGDPHPGILLLPDVIGLRPQIRRMAERIAGWGYVVLAPNLVYREHAEVPLVPGVDLLSDPGAMPGLLATTSGWTKSVPRADIVRDAEAWLAWLRPQLSGDRVGIAGYCYGGLLALWLAEHLGESVAAAGMFHPGGLVTDADDSPHRHVAHVQAELLIRPADADPSLNDEAQRSLAAALDAAGVRYTQEVYPHAGHGYTMADTPRYQQVAAERHFEELRALFDRTLA